MNRSPLVLAHRGARTVAPENTLVAFSTALDQGAAGVELDVHRTADDGLVVHHDAEAPGLGVLAERSLLEIWQGAAVERVRTYLRDRLFPICTACCRYYGGAGALSTRAARDG